MHRNNIDAKIVSMLPSIQMKNQYSCELNGELRKYKKELERHLEVVLLCSELMDCLNEDVEFDHRLFKRKIRALIVLEKMNSIILKINSVFDSISIKAMGEEAYIESLLLNIQNVLAKKSHFVNIEKKREELKGSSDMLLVYVDQLNSHMESISCLEDTYV